MEPDFYRYFIDNYVMMIHAGSLGATPLPTPVAGTVGGAKIWPTPYHGWIGTWPPGTHVGHRVKSCDHNAEFEWDGSQWASAQWASAHRIGAPPPAIAAMSMNTYVGGIDTWPQQNTKGEKAMSRDTGFEYTWSGHAWVLSSLYEALQKTETLGPTGTVALQLPPEEFSAFEHYCTKEGTTMQKTLQSLLEDLLSRARIDPKDFKVEVKF